MKTYSIDTRTLKPGDIYIALKGENHDGHDFVEAAFQRGASAAMVNSSSSRLPFLQQGKIIQVPDTLQALQDLAHEHLLKMPAKRVGLTGSSGKTTTKELIAAACVACLGEKAVFFNTGNLNNHIGLPLSALRVSPEHQIAIFEMGMSHFGEIALLAKIAQPQIGLITNIGSAHGSNLGGPQGIAKAKAELFEALEPRAIGIVNQDDPSCVHEAKNKLKAKTLSFGQSAQADIRIVNPEKPSFAYQDQTISIHLPLLGHHNIQNAAAALAVAVALGLDFKTAALGLEQVKAIKGRLQKHTLKNGVILLDDTYNANPDSMRAGLKVLASFKNQRKIAVLGDMAELENAPEEHRKLGDLVRENKIDLFLACGPQAQAYQADFWAPDSIALGQLLLDKIQPGDLIWIKGSRSMALEKAVDALIKSDN